MSANQVPGRVHERDTSVHSCTVCWKNGGAGHRLDRVTVVDSFGTRRATAHKSYSTRAEIAEGIAALLATIK